MDGWSYPGIESLLWGSIVVLSFGLFGAGILRVLFSPRLTDQRRPQTTETADDRERQRNEER